MFKRYRLIEDGDGYTLVLYVDPHSTEFSGEFGQKIQKKAKAANEKIASYVKNNFSNIRVKTVKVMLGATLIATIPFHADVAKAHDVDFNMSYLYFGSTDSFIKQVERTQGNLNVTSPSYFDINADGSLKISGLFDEAFVKEMHKQNIKVVPFLSNHWDREIGRAALENREELAQDIADFIEEHELDGINVDIENVTEVDRDKYTDLVKLLREKIPKDKEVSVAVAANPGDWQKGWHGSYDYKALAEYADYLMIMSYDEHYEGGEEGPVASYSWVEDSIEYALDQDVPPEKIVLGLPFFGRYWIEGQSYGGLGISNTRVESLVQKYDGTIIFDERAQSPKAIVEIGPDDPVTTIAGKALKPGTYHIWYENEESIAAKMSLVHKYNLKGTGSWSLGQENPNLWVNFEKMRTQHDYVVELPPPPQDNLADSDTIPNQSIYFNDITGHWAKDDITAVANKGWMTGMETSIFGPQSQLTRAQVATILVRALDLKPLDPDKSATESFNDVEKSWAKKEIAIIEQHGLMEGKGDKEFAPDTAITREEMAVLLDRLFEDTEVSATNDTNSAFTDVKQGHWSYDSINKMSKQGVFNGFEDQTFRPSEKMTRAQMASLLNRIAPVLDLEENVILNLGSFGPGVTKLQSDLAFLGYFDHNITSYYGQVTYDAVKEFQQKYDLDVDGIAGPKTLDKLKEVINEKG